MKVELTVKSSYLPSWGVWEGVREIVQNAKDAASEHNGEFSVTHTDGKLVVRNEGSTLDTKALLIGHTSKVGRDDLIGQFGEGLKLGVLALVRKGVEVKILTGDKVWLPVFTMSEFFGEEVLAFEVQDADSFSNEVRVEIGISEDTWSDYKHRFVFLNDITKLAGIKGEVILNEECAGRLYVKGIYVETVDTFKYGYNYTHAWVDRDRKAVGSFAKGWETAAIWCNLDDEIPVAEFYDLLNSYTYKDLEGFTHDHARILPSSIKDSLIDRFSSEFGKDAYPVQTMQDSMELEHLNIKGVVCPTAFLGLYEQTKGPVASKLAELKKEACKQYSWHDFSQEEKDSLRKASFLVKEAIGLDGEPLSYVSVVDFRSDSILGMFKEGRVLIAKKVLSDFPNTIATLLHEFAHTAGPDGSFAHINKLEEYWTNLLRSKTLSIDID